MDENNEERDEDGSGNKQEAGKVGSGGNV